MNATTTLECLQNNEQEIEEMIEEWFDKLERGANDQVLDEIALHWLETLEGQ